MGELIVIAIIIGVVCAIISVVNSSEEQKRKQERLSAIYQKYNAPEDRLFDIVCCNGGGIIDNQRYYSIWYDKSTFKFLDVYNDSFFEIEDSKISNFNLIGEAHYVNVVTGGGGGGTSIGGAIIGGVIAGPVGAVIGSRKKQKKIESEVQYIDNTQTILTVSSLDAEKHLVFKGSVLYNYLIQLIPDKLK